MKRLFTVLAIGFSLLGMTAMGSAQTVQFDLESCNVYSPLPVSQTVNGITATFSGNFSVQSADTTFCRQIALTGNYLWPSSLDRNVLTVKFDHPLVALTFPFATVDYQDNAEIPANVLMTAYTGTTTIGTATDHGTYNGAFFPEGRITFNAPAGQTFDSITLVVPWCSTGTTNLLADNFEATVYATGGTAKTRLIVPPVGGAIGRYVTLNAILRDPVTMTGIPGENLQFAVDGTNVGGPVVTDVLGKAKISVLLAEGTPLGSHSVVVSFPGDGTYAPKTATNTLTVSPGPVRLTVGNRTVTLPYAVTLSAKLTNWTRTPLSGETISFAIGGTGVGSAVTDSFGIARLKVKLPAGTTAGTYTITADFAGDASHTAGSGSGTLTVK